MKTFAQYAIGFATLAVLNVGAILLDVVAADGQTDNAAAGPLLAFPATACRPGECVTTGGANNVLTTNRTYKCEPEQVPVQLLGGVIKCAPWTTLVDPK